MEGLRWILLLVGLFLIAAIYWSGRRHEDPAQESLLERARREAARDQRPSDEGESRAAAFEAPDVDVTEEAPYTADEAPEAAVEPAVPPERQEPGGIGAAVDAPAEASEDEGAAPPLGADEGATASEPSRTAVAPRASGGEASDASPGTQSAQGGAGDEAPMVVLFLVAAEGERLVGARLAEAFARHGLEHGEYGIFHARDGDGATVFSVANAVEPGTFDPATMDTFSTPGLVMVLRLPGPQWAETAFDRMVSTARKLADELGARVLDGNRSTLTRQTEQHLRDDLRAFDLRRSHGPL